MPTSDEYRKRAEECAMRAAATKDPDRKRQYEKMADGWLKRAESAERLETCFVKETPSAS
jgi:hypothetical protein